VLGGQRFGVRRPQARAVDATELGLSTFAWTAAADPLYTATMAAIAAGVSMRRYGSPLEPLPAPKAALSTCKSATSRRFVALSEQQLAQWLSCPWANPICPGDDDGIHLRDRVILVALRKAIVQCFGATALVRRCQEHKRRNVIEHLPQKLHASVGSVPAAGLPLQPASWLTQPLRLPSTVATLARP
jgi:putative transposase